MHPLSTVRSRRFISFSQSAFSQSALTDHVLCVFAEYFSNKSLCRQRNIMEKDSQHTRTAGSDGQMAMGYNFYFFNFIIMMSCYHMSTQIQIPYPKVYIIFYPPISCLQNSFLTKFKKNILQIPKLYFAKQILIFYSCLKREQLIPKSKEFDLITIYLLK